MDNGEKALEDHIAKRLLSRIEAESPQPPPESRKHLRVLVSAPTPVKPAPAEKSDLPTPTDFAKIERNFASLGFFTPSSKRIKNLKGKEISFKKEIDGKLVEAKTTIAPSALYGLPITADQDKYLALQKIITNILREEGELKNPITFTTAEILKILGLSDAGAHYKEIEEWFKVMTGTMIVSEGTVYLRGQKKWARDMFHVFDRAVAVGKELPDGTIADRNYVWLSDWQLENINYKWLIPIDLEPYRKLKNHITKGLVPLLQIWLFASRERGAFEKRYGELCELLNIRKYKKLAEVRRWFVPSLDELREHEYLSAWRIERTWDRKDFKIVLVHGPRFSQDRLRLRAGDSAGPRTASEDAVGEEQPEAVLTSDELPPAPNDPRLAALVACGVTEKAAKKVLFGVADNQPVLDQLEWGDAVIAADPQKIQNPAGFYVSLIRDNVTVPDTFETSRKRADREAKAQAWQAEREARARLEAAYKAYQQREVDNYLAGLKPGALDDLLQREKTALLEEFKNLKHWNDEQLLKLAKVRLEAATAKQLPLQSFAAFCEKQKGGEGATLAG